ncbi:MAG: dihydroorotate dehydrogenase [bacterium]
MQKKSNQQIIEILKNGKIKFATVSGVLTTKPNLIEWVDNEIPEIDLITSKSYQVKPNQGNREPIFTETFVGSYANAVGLQNPGMEKAYNDLVELKNRHEMRALLNVSISANSIEDFITLVKKFEDVADILELNFSCPHAKVGYGSSIGCDADLVEKYIKEIRKSTSILLFPKLTPNVENIGKIALAAIDGGADGIVAINTVGPEVYIEPRTQKPILNNPNGHKGGKSGNWIKKIALEKITEIRKAVGLDVPIIGMGGVSNGEDVINLKKAGADVVGVGSVLARVRQKSMPAFFTALKKDAENLKSPQPPFAKWGKFKNSSDKFLRNDRLAEYKPYKIKKIIEKTKDLKIFELSGHIDYDASQYVFIWEKSISGEKPFAIVKNNPLTFLIRKREYNPEEKRGLVTHSLFELKEGDEMMIRGVYGADAPNSEKKNVCIIAGGTSIAIIPKLVEKLSEQGKKITVYYGTVSEDQIVFKEEIEKFAKYISVIDNDVVARVLNVAKEDLKKEDSLEDFCFYNVGPTAFIKAAMDIEKNLGGDIKDIFACVETNNMCGMGVCGECECGGILTCQEGTFFNMDFLESKNIDIIKL